MLIEYIITNIFFVWDKCTFSIVSMKKLKYLAKGCNGEGMRVSNANDQTQMHANAQKEQEGKKETKQSITL